jgi:hypothetical protein
VSKRSYRRLAVVAGAALACGTMAPAMAARVSAGEGAGATASVNTVDISDVTGLLPLNQQVLGGLGLGGDLVLGGLQLTGVVDPGSLAVELLVGQLGIASVVLASRLLVAHCASLASWWRPLG